ncbi:ankyrin repeat-containing domain protein [Hypoxylon sp. FL1857]|nr:ankyrin repeat-containing domain protein [Hypoxylon sp. FL1857]
MNEPQRDHGRLPLRTGGGGDQSFPFGDGYERPETIVPNSHDTLRDDDQTQTLRSILSYGDDDPAEEEILRPHFDEPTGASRSEAFKSFLENLLQSEQQRSRKKAPQFPDITERTTSNPRRIFSDRREALQALNNTFQKNVDLDNLRNFSRKKKKTKGSKSSWAPLHYTAQVGNLDLCQALLEKGAFVDSRDNDNWTPLMSAANSGHVGVCNLLLEFGADVNATGDLGYTPLTRACIRERVETVDFLISKGADLEAPWRDGSPPLQLVIICGKSYHLKPEKVEDTYQVNLYNIAKLLLENGCDPNGPDDEGYTALMVAAQRHNLSLAELLLAHSANPNYVSETRRPPLLYAACACDPAMVRLLLEHGADPKIREQRRWTALHLAAQNEDESEDSLGVVKLLVGTNDIDIDAQEDGGSTALYLAVQGNSYDTVEFLMDANADPNIETTSDISPLERAIANSNLPIVNLLLSREADPRRVDKKGLGILHSAAMQSDVAVLRRVLEEDVDLELRTTDVDRVTALQLAVQNDNAQIAMTLLEYGAQP